MTDPRLTAHSSRPAAESSITSILAGAVGLWLFATAYLVIVLIGATVSFVGWFIVTPIKAVARGSCFVARWVRR